MTARLRLAAALLTLSSVALTRAAEEAPAPTPAPAPTTTSQSTKDAIRARIREDAKKQAATKPAAPAAATAAKPGDAAPSPVAPTSTPIAATEKEKNSTDTASGTTPAPAKPAAEDPALTLPKVEVNRSKQIHPLAYELFDKEREAAREKELTKPSELDKALNNSKVNIPLFGGQSAASRASVASERTALLEAEADLIEEIGRAKTKEQKAELRKQLDELKKVRRELEHAIH